MATPATSRHRLGLAIVKQSVELHGVQLLMKAGKGLEPSSRLFCRRAVLGAPNEENPVIDGEKYLRSNLVLALGFEGYDAGPSGRQESLPPASGCLT